jgi:hypothetical protein
MATGVAAAAPSPDISNQKITTAPVGSFADHIAKLQIESIGSPPLPQNTLQAFGQGIYTNITA